MAEWVKTLTVSMCILTLLMHLIPKGKFEKYVRFYAGLLFFLLAVQPVLRFFGQSGELERLLELEFLKEDYDDLETAMDGLEELKNEKIQQYYQKEIIRQVRAIAEAYKLGNPAVNVIFGADGYEVQDILIQTDGSLSAEQTVSVKQELLEVYSLLEEQIRIELWEGM